VSVCSLWQDCLEVFFLGCVCLCLEDGCVSVVVVLRVCF